MNIADWPNATSHDGKPIYPQAITKAGIISESWLDQQNGIVLSPIYIRNVTAGYVIHAFRLHNSYLDLAVV